MDVLVVVVGFLRILGGVVYRGSIHTTRGFGSTLGVWSTREFDVLGGLDILGGLGMLGGCDVLGWLDLLLGGMLVGFISSSMTIEEREGCRL